MATFAFAGGVTAVSPWGQQNAEQFSGSWALNESWTLAFTTSTGDFLVGKGNIAGLEYSCGLLLRNRVFVGAGASFIGSDNGDPTEWEEQGPGTITVNLSTQYGDQDTVQAFASFQGKLAVFQTKTIQIWNIDADPANFSLSQPLDNIGTIAPLSVVQVGDFDVLFLDTTGIRSLRWREVTLNAFPDDTGLPIDSLVQEAINGVDVSASCGICEPTSKRYMLFIIDKIYVLSMFKSSKITAWSIYTPTYERTTIIAPSDTHYDGAGNVSFTPSVVGAVYTWAKGINEVSLTPNGGTTLVASGSYVAANVNGAVGVGTPLAVITGTLTEKKQTAFTPQKFITFNGLVYTRTTDGDLLVYGGTDNRTYDSCVARFQTPWLDDKSPGDMKYDPKMSLALRGHWVISAGMDPVSAILETAFDAGSNTSPDFNTDSTFDIGPVVFSSAGTHFCIQGVTSALCSKVCTFSAVLFYYNKAARPGP